MRHRRLLDAQSGFTLTELLISMAITVGIMASLFSVLNPAEGTYQAQPEVADMQQRLRVGVDTLNKDIMMAGAGLYTGSEVGALLNFFAPIMPYRVGGTTPDPPGSFKPDTITLLYVPDTSSQTTIQNPMPATSNEIKTETPPGCDDLSACGFKDGMTVLIFDETGAWNIFTITNVQNNAGGGSGHIQRHGPDFMKDYGTGSHVVQVLSHTYYLKSDDATETYQLMHFDGLTDVPVVDNVVGLTFQYFGSPQPPTLVKPVTSSPGPWTTYGPKPVPLGVPSLTGYPDGENCVFKVENGQQVGRLDDLTPGSSALVEITPNMLTDGPWCPTPAMGPGSFDADLFRIRQVRVTIRLQSNAKMLRGPAGDLFTKGGWARGGEMWVPDQQLTFDVTPRNMNLGR